MKTLNTKVLLAGAALCMSLTASAQAVNNNKADQIDYSKEITEAEYKNIMAIIQSCPAAEGKGYRLKTDMTWEEYDLAPVPEPSDEDELSDAEALNVIMGVTA